MKPDSTEIDDMCTALAVQIRDYEQEAGMRLVHKLSVKGGVLSEAVEKPVVDTIVVTDGSFDLYGAGDELASVQLVVTYFRPRVSAAPDDKAVRLAIERIRNAILSNARVGQANDIISLSSDKVFETPEGQEEQLLGGQIVVDYAVPSGAFTMEPR